MSQFIFRRVLQAIPTIFGITILTYALLNAAPGSPVATLAFGPRTTTAQKNALAEQLGINDPVWKQYIRWLIGNDWQEFRKLDGRGNVVTDANGEPIMERGTQKGILRGDFGESFTSKRNALEVVVEKFPATAELGGLALLVGVVIGIPIGVIAAVRRGGLFDNITRVMAVIFSAVPVFWLGLTLLLIFGSQLGWLPMGGRHPSDYFLTGKVTLLQRIEHLILPVTVLATGWVAIFSRFMRASTLDVLSQDYVRTAQAKGLKYHQVWFTHAARNALIPIATILGYLLSDILYALIDPRIRLS